MLEGAPTGSMSVGCGPTAAYWTDGQADLTLTAGQDASCEVHVVKFNPDAPAIHLGASLDPIAILVRFDVVPPNSAPRPSGDGDDAHVCGPASGLLIVVR